MSPNTFRISSSNITSKIMDGEAIVIDLSTGIYYSLDDVGGVVWQGVEESQSRQAILNHILATYDVSEDIAAADLDRLLSEMTAAALIAPAEESAESAEPFDAGAPDSKAEYRSPQLNKYEDMAELFALDPPLPDARRTG